MSVICSWFQNNSLKIHHLYLVSREFPDNQLLEHLHGHKLTCYTCPSCLKFQMISVGFGRSLGESSVISFLEKCIVTKTDKCKPLMAWHVCSLLSVWVFFRSKFSLVIQVKSAHNIVQYWLSPAGVAKHLEHTLGGRAFRTAHAGFRHCPPPQVFTE